MTAPILPDAVKSLMSPKEKVLWMEKPNLRHLSFSISTEMIGSLVFTIFGLASLFGFNIFPMFQFGGFFIPLIWVITGLFTLVGRPLARLYQLHMTTYVLTDRRLAIHQDGFWGKTTSYNLNTLGELQFHRERDGYGSIVIAGNAIQLGNTTNQGDNPSNANALRQIPNVAQVFELIVAAKEKTAVQEMPVLTETPAVPRRVF